MRHPADGNDATRRGALRWVAGLSVGAFALPVVAQERRPEIVQPGSPGRKGLMARAFEMQRLATERGDQAFGAVVVRDGQVVGEGVSGVLTTPDPTAHGEIQAIRDAARRLGTARLAGCELYTTFRPCPMCETAAYWAGIARIFHGEAIVDAGVPRLPRC